MSFTGLMVATPCYGGVVTNAYLLSMLRTSATLTGRGIKHEVVTVPGDSLVMRARNALVAVFMASAHSHLLFIDADIEWQPEAVLRLLAADKDVICAAYPKKFLPVTYAINLKRDADGRARQCPSSGAVEIMDAAAGFLMIRRAVFERMMAAYPQTRYVPAQGLTVEQGALTYALFDCVVETIDGAPRFLSEDYGFCHRWRAIGGEIWLDPGIRLNHHGTMSYEGDVSTLFTAADIPARGS
jgi:hypothetical protein